MATPPFNKVLATNGAGKQQGADLKNGSLYKRCREHSSSL